MKKNFLLASVTLLCATFAFALFSCKKDKDVKPNDKVEVQKLEVNPTSMTLKVGESKDFAITIEPRNAGYKAESDKPEVATVDGLKVKALAAGTANIKITAGSKTATIAVTVEEKTNVQIDPSHVAGYIYWLLPSKIKEEKETIYQIMRTPEMGWTSVIGGEDTYETGKYSEQMYPFMKTDEAFDAGKGIFATVLYIHTPSKGVPFINAFTYFKEEANIKETLLKEGNESELGKMFDMEFVNRKDVEGTNAVYYKKNGFDNLTAVVYVEKNEKEHADVLYMQIFEASGSQSAEQMVKNCMEMKHIPFAIQAR